ncbi:uncharacterized protein LOC100207736 isoform X4 [Hydra vulgaris]|uniref:Uncharacterized protein LOC100207736 isoform X4 n=1 Tax=Hydra vulgaris TaxID=6087 RepID=A0ABM4DF46_HYDVU
MISRTLFWSLIIVKEYHTRTIKNRREKNKSMQRIDNGEISFLLDFKTAEAFIPEIPNVTIKVRRNTIEYSKEVPIIKVKYEVVEATKLLVNLDLDSVYEDENGYKVYELEKCLHSDLKFHLKIEVQFANNYIVAKYTRNFTLKGKKRSRNDEKKQKLSLHDQGSALCNEEIISSETLRNSSSSSISSMFSRFQDSERVIACKKLVTQHIEAKSLQVDQLKCGTAIYTSNGDIAYHWPLENPNERFEEGEVVGFIADAIGKYALRKLTLQNCKEALLKGVISRSYYLEAQVPKDGRRSETICLMGIVPVQVKGSVCINDALYASPNHPGFAVSGYHLTEKELRGAALVGYAFSSQKVDDEFAQGSSRFLKEGMVQAGVSVLETVSQCLHDVRLQKLEDSIEEKLEAVKHVQKKSKNCTCICFAVTILVFVLFSALLLQVFLPGSKLRLAVCSYGSLRRISKFFFMRNNGFINTDNVVRVTGIEFDLPRLKKKTSKSMHDSENGNKKDFRYYLNVKKCAFSGIRNDENSLSYDIYGPDEFAIDINCTKVYYFDDIHNIWKPYTIADALFCES